MPVRKVRNRGKNIIGKFPSRKMGRMVAYESLIERDTIYLLEFDNGVSRYEEQPLTIRYEDDGKERHYTPDFWVLLENGRQCLVECKPARHVMKEKNQRKYAAARPWCRQHDIAFLVVTDKQLRQGHLLKNVQALSQYALLDSVPTITAEIEEIIKSSDTPPTLADVFDSIQLLSPPNRIPMLYHLLYRQRIFTLLEKVPLSDESVLYVEKEVYDGVQSVLPWHTVFMDGGEV